MKEVSFKENCYLFLIKCCCSCIHYLNAMFSKSTVTFILSDLAKEALSYWWKRLQKEPPHRKIVRCQETCHISWINIIRRTIHNKQTLCIATPSTIWERPELLTQSDAVGVNGSTEAVWLAALVEGLATLDIPMGTRLYY